MTNVYGVTFMGAKEQILKQIVAAYPDIQAETGIKSGVISAYLTKKVFEALSTMFGGAHHIQKWLGQCGARICQSVSARQLEDLESYWSTHGKTMSPLEFSKLDAMCTHKSTIIWTTPLNMPVVQPYRAAQMKTVSTIMQNMTLREHCSSNNVSYRKQLQAFPPNFIHSLDASHMILSALECDKAGLSFAAVHDSFWTHACDVDAMNGILRDAFIRLHSDDVIGRLAAELTTRYKGSMYLLKVDIKGEVGKRVVQARAAMIKNMSPIFAGRDRKRGLRALELLAECKRLRLLASKDPLEVAEGKAMITPASVLDAATNMNVVDDEVEDLGSIEDVMAGLTEDGAQLEHPPVVDEAGDFDESSTAFERRLHKKQVAGKRYALVWVPWSLPPVPTKVCLPSPRRLLN